MESARCPSCHAVIAVGAPWCTLCFADVRSAPSPEPAMAGARVTDEPMALPPHPILDGPLHLIETADTVVEAPITKSEDVRLAEPSWPCTVCGTSVSLEATACPGCGAGFLDGVVSSTSLTLPGVGDVAKLSGSHRVMLMAGGAMACTVAIYLVLYVLGHLV